MSTEKPTPTAPNDEESQGSKKSIPHWRMIIDQGITTPEVEKWHYEGSGTEEDPYAVIWIDNDPRNPMNFGFMYRWMIVLMMAFSVLAVALCSSAFSGGKNFSLTLLTKLIITGVPEIMAQYHASEELGILGLSLFVLGFAIGRKCCQSQNFMGSY
jgi:hypothetical protein